MTAAIKDGGTRLVIEALRVAGSGGGFEVIPEVSLTVAAGEILGLVGESGSGKTTTGLAILGVARRGLVVASGRVVIDGSDLLARSSDERRRQRGAVVTYVPQDPGAALNPALRIDEQLREIFAEHARQLDGRAVSDRIDSLLRTVQLADPAVVRRKYPHQLSGGQQQRVAIAMAFACDPAVIVLDEPTTGLDVSTQRHILTMVRDLCREQRAAAVYVSHDLAVVRSLADRVAVMYAGRVIEEGPTADVFAAPQHPYTVGLLAAVPSGEPGSRLVGIAGRPPRPTESLPGCSFAPRCPLADAECTRAVPELVELAQAHRRVRCLKPGELALPTRGAATGSTTPAQSRPAVLRVVDLRANYGDREVLHGVSLAVAPRECVGVVGESGSGKSTLARCIIGLHGDARDGLVELAGQTLAPAVRRRTRDQWRRLQFVFQNPYSSLNPRRTVGDSLLIALHQLRPELAREGRDRAVAALEDVALSQRYFGQYPDELSGGERQRAAIARALVAEPDVLVCDEVTSALDVSVQAVVVETLRHLQQTRDLALIFITHNITLVQEIAHSVVVMSQGTVVEHGPTEQVLRHPAHEYTQSLLRDVNDLSQQHDGKDSA